MRFSENGYYIEHYVKCANCGMLVYGEGIAGDAPRQGLRLLLALVRRVGGADATARPATSSLPIVQPSLPVEDRSPPRAHRRRPTWS